jgi:hypothetical protein
LRGTAPPAHPLLPRVLAMSVDPSLCGLLPDRRIRALVDAGAILAGQPLAAGQVQPASLDLRLGARAWRVRDGGWPTGWPTLPCTRSTCPRVRCSRRAASMWSNWSSALPCPAGSRPPPTRKARPAGSTC